MTFQLSLQEIVEKILLSERRNKYCRIIAIDGPAGAGKSTLAHRITGAFPSSKIAIIHMDDLYAGWEDALTPTLTKSLEFNIAYPASQGKAIEFKKYDWFAKNFGDFQRIELPELLILEGVGSGQKAVRKYLDQLIWIDIEPEIGLSRVLHRDGDYMENEMRVWQMREREHFRSDNTRDCATVRVDGTRFI